MDYYSTTTTKRNVMRHIKSLMSFALIMFFAVFTAQAMETSHEDQEYSHQLTLNASEDCFNHSFDLNTNVEADQQTARISWSLKSDVGNASNVDSINVQEFDDVNVTKELLAESRVLKPPVNA